MGNKNSLQSLLQQEIEQAQRAAQILSTNIIEHKFSKELTRARVIPINDLHVGDRFTDLKAIKRLFKEIYNSANTYVILLGDLMNNGIKSSKTNTYEEVLTPHEQKMWLLENLYPIRDRILCVVNGNHERRSSKEVNAHPLLDIAISLLGKDEGQKLYRDDGAFIKISLGKRIHSCRQVPYNIFVTHGSGGGSIGASLNRLQLVSMFLEGIDLAIMGHVHQQANHTYSKIVFNDQNIVIRQRPVKCLISGAWGDYGGYAMQGMMKPASKGESIIELNGKVKEMKIIS